MRYQYRRSWEETTAARAFSEKAFRRRTLAAWDARWQQLTVQARYLFLHTVKLPDRDPFASGTPPSTSRDAFPPHVLDELTAAGFVKIEPARSAATIDRVFLDNLADDFAWRGRIMRRMHLLDSNRPTELSKYVEEVFYSSDLLPAIVGVLHKTGFEGYFRFDERLWRYITGHCWPDWVANALAAPLATPILKLLNESGGAMPLLELCGRIAGSTPEKVRAVVDQLITHLVLVEDFQPETWELMVGFLPAVREKMILASRPRERPPLVICEHPKEVAPPGSVLLNDLRAVLLEIAGGPPRLRGDGELYQREVDRFLPFLDPLPEWLLEALRWSALERLSEAVRYAGALEFVKEVAEDRVVRLHLTSTGHQWLSSGIEEQYAAFVGHFTQPPVRDEHLQEPEAGYVPRSRPSAPVVSDERRFFGEQITVQKVDKRGTTAANWGLVKPPEQLTLRPHVDRALAVLKPGVFYQLDSVSAHLAFGAHNPLNAGLPPDQTRVSLAHRPVPPLDDERDEAGRRLITTLAIERLIPLGCVRAAIDQEGTICIARELSCELYFGHKIDLAGLAAPGDHPGRVVVQPDFSVIVIGLNPSSLADLALFCERTSKGGSQGATLLKITRSAVVKAVRLGLKPEEIVARLTRHASNEIPANVLREVKEWSSWVRTVTLSTMTVVRCGDRDTADRVMAVLRHQSERISDTMIAIDHEKLTPNERDRLLGQGIIIQADSDARDELDRELAAISSGLAVLRRGLPKRRSSF